MLQQAAMGAGIMTVFYGGAFLVILTPIMSILVFNAIKWILMKYNPTIGELTGFRKGIAIVASILLGIPLAFLLIYFVFWLLFKDVSFD